MVKVVFVCLGNICRSPMAEAIFRQLVRDEGLADQIEVDSAGTSDWHIDSIPHEGTRKILNEYQIPVDGMKARQFRSEDLDEFDYIIAMDRSNIENMQAIHKQGDQDKVILLLDLIEDTDDKDVPDPFFTGDFDQTYDLVTKGTQALLEKIKREQQL